MNGYYPRRPKAIEAAERDRRPKEKVIHGTVQRQSRYPIFEVTAGGKTVEWTDLRGEAHKAYAAADTLPKRLVMVAQDGQKTLLEEVPITAHIGKEE